MKYIDGITKHYHGYMLVKGDISWSDPLGNKYVIDYYTCECRKLKIVKTPKAIYDKGNKVFIDA